RPALTVGDHREERSCYPDLLTSRIEEFRPRPHGESLVRPGGALRTLRMLLAVGLAVPLCAARIAEAAAPVAPGRVGPGRWVTVSGIRFLVPPPGRTV